ncbi:hypothetical protein [Halomarina oriensis]|uniref:Uncharacterized protein n=1 Tax=Halomarina oriensis TaxID=671145 RepID=A0A6B0GV85_9EURY|nr:hypothetical protein [Halomarina oriensis]MWG36035.1 hypothetical protein [Halomarina oriensis]
MNAWRVADPSARLGDDDELRPPVETTPEDAQSMANFVVFDPTWLPEDCRVETVTARPERPPGRPDGVDTEEVGQTPWSEGNPSSVRVVVTGDGRRVRLKQFCYDWAPPAASIAPLWRTRRPEPFDCAGTVGWLGTDYKDNRGACVQRDRTQLELSVEDGVFDDGELRRLLSGLLPAAPATAAVVRGVPFHQLSYWVRYQCRPPSVPHGVWNHSPERPYDGSDPRSLVSLVGDDPVETLQPPGERYVFDSAVAFPEHDAVEAVFRHRENGTDHLWLTATSADSPLAPTLPPEPADQSAETRTAVGRRGTTVHVGALDEDNGAWEALWTEGDVRYGVWAGASQSLDGAAFRSLVDSLEAV